MSEQVMEPLVAPEDLAKLLSVTTGQLAQMSYLGTGPKYVKVGTRVSIGCFNCSEMTRQRVPRDALSSKQGGVSSARLCEPFHVSNPCSRCHMIAWHDEGTRAVRRCSSQQDQHKPLAVRSRRTLRLRTERPA